MRRERSVRLPCVRGDAGVQIVHVQSGASAVGRFTDDVAKQVQRVGQRAREGVFKHLRDRFSLPCFGEVDGEETVHDDGVKLALNRVWKSVTTFDLGEEASGDEETLLLKRS